MKKSIFWQKKIYEISIDLTGKEIGDSVHSPISAADLIERTPFELPVLKIKVGDVTAYFNNFYFRTDGLTQVIFMSFLNSELDPAIKYLVLSDDEFTIIGG